MLALAVSPLYAAGDDPESVLRAFVDATNAHDFEALLNLFADDIQLVNAHQGSTSESSTLEGKDQVTQAYVAAAKVFASDQKARAEFEAQRLEIMGPVSVQN